MKKVKLLTQVSTLALAFGVAISASAYHGHSHGHCPYHMPAKMMSAKFVDYGVINPGQTTWMAVPAGVTPGSRVACWSRDLTNGKIKIDVPNYGKVKLTPNNPLVVFAAPQDMKFSTNYHTHKSFMNKFGMGQKTTYMPARLVCKFQG